VCGEGERHVCGERETCGGERGRKRERRVTKSDRRREMKIGKLEGFEPVKAGWELDEVDGFDLDAGVGCERLGCVVFLAGRGLDLEWGL
jgi:hypothetical protein